MRFTDEFQPIIRGNVPPDKATKHQAGFSCITQAAYTYDANGHRRWCTDCGAELGVPEPVDAVLAVQAQARLLGVALAFVGLILLLAFAAWLTPSGAAPSGPVQTPTTYGYPSYGQVPDPGVRPPSVPVVR
jgi:hypothetical protein